MDYKLMTNEQLVVLSQGGDKKALDILVEKNLRLFYLIAHKYSKPSRDNFEDLTSIAKMGFLKAVDNFDVEKGFLFVTYASRIMFNEINQSFRKSNRVLNNESPVLESVISKFEGSELTMLDTIPSDDDTPEDIMIDKETISELHSYIAKLPEKERQIIYMFYFEDMKQNEIAKEMNLSQAYVSRLIGYSINRLREQFKKLEV